MILSVPLARRAGSRLLSAYRAKKITLSNDEEMACVDVCAFPYIRGPLRERISKAWRVKGPMAGPPTRADPRDEELDAILAT